MARFVSLRHPAEVERIHYSWPRTPAEPTDTPEFTRILFERGLPFDAEDPLIFHVLTTLDENDSGEEQLLNAMRTGASLVPRVYIEEKWGSGKGMVFARDKAAGDDEYLFMTPCNIITGVGVDTRYRPAVAFRLSYVIQQTKIAFRVHDLEPQYKAVEDRLVGESIGYNEDEEELTEKDEEDRKAIHEMYSAETVTDELQGVAECGTQYDPEDAAALTRLYAEICGGFRRDVGGAILADDPERLYIWESAMNLLPECIRELLEDAEHWSDEAFIRDIIEGLEASWGKLFLGAAKVMWGFPSELLHTVGSERPELMVKGDLPLCEAAFYRNADQGWVLVPLEVCEAGKAA